MVKKKICMLGSFGVGKTSLTSRFVVSLFDEKYHTSIGVKVDKKVVQLDGKEVTLMLWDMAGEEENLPIKLNYVRDAAGYILVMDGLRAKTLEVALNIQERVRTNIGNLPLVLAVNKKDQRESWEIRDSHITELAARGWPLFETSAKTGEQVEEMFLTLTGLIMKAQDERSDDPLAEHP